MVLALMVFAQSASNGNTANPTTEYRVKAAFLLSFPKFIEWPSEAFESSTAPWRIGVLNSPEMVQVLNTGSDKKIRGRSIEIIVMDELTADQDYHVLFIGNADGENAHNAEDLSVILSDYLQSPVLVVSEDKESFAAGGVINFYLERGKTRFEIHTRAAQQHQLVIGANLLRVARLVED